MPEQEPTEIPDTVRVLDLGTATLTDIETPDTVRILDLGTATLTDIEGA